MAKMIGLGAIDLDHLGVSAPLAERPKNMSAPTIASAKRAQRRVDGMRRLPLVHALRAAAIDDALGVAENDVRRLEAHRLDQLEAGDAGGAGAVAHEPRRLDVAPGQLHGVDHAGGGDDRGAVLVVVENRECPSISRRRSSMMKHSGALMSSRLMPPNDGPEIAHALMNSSGSSVSISRSIASTSAKRLNSTALPSITGFDGQRAEIAEAENGGAVGDDRDHIAARGIVVGLRRIGGDRLQGTATPGE